MKGSDEGKALETLSMEAAQSAVIGAYSACRAASEKYEAVKKERAACAGSKGPDGCDGCHAPCQIRLMQEISGQNVTRAIADTLEAAQMLTRKFCAEHNLDFDEFTAYSAKTWNDINNRAEHREAMRKKAGKKE